LGGAFFGAAFFGAGFFAAVFFFGALRFAAFAGFFFCGMSVSLSAGAARELPPTVMVRVQGPPQPPVHGAADLTLPSPRRASKFLAARGAAPAASWRLRTRPRTGRAKDFACRVAAVPSS
jgi:hypothetical protein